MKFAVCFLAIVSCAAAMPAELFPIEDEELDLSNIEGNDIYLEPVNPANETDFPEGRIIGGSEVARNSVPYICMLLINGGSLCGGSLIAPTRVLTAAHCTIQATRIEVRCGAHAFNSNEPTQVRINAISVRNHPNYNQGSFAGNDVAVITLQSAMPINNNIRTIALAAANAGTFAGSRGFLAGWGRMNNGNIAANLRGVNLNIITNAVCANSFGNNVVASSLCTSGAGPVGACNGDSGGPLVVNNVQVGIVSFGASNCVSGNPTVFARVSSFRNWIG